MVSRLQRNIYSSEVGLDQEVVDSLFLEEAVSQLPDPLRAVLCLRTDGYIQQETADLLGISRTKARRDEKKALQVLKNFFSAHEIEEVR